MDSGRAEISISASAYGEKPHIVVRGSRIRVLHDFVELAGHVCKFLGVSPESLVRKLPELIREHEKRASANGALGGAV